MSILDKTTLTKPSDLSDPSKASAISEERELFKDILKANDRDLQHIIKCRYGIKRRVSTSIMTSPSGSSFTEKLSERLGYAQDMAQDTWSEGFSV